MPKLKKLLSMFLIAAVMLSTFAACAGDSEDKDSETTPADSVTEEATEEETTTTKADIEITEPEETTTTESQESTIETVDPDYSSVPETTPDANEEVSGGVITPPATQPVNLEDYQALNPDTVAWINIPDTRVNYPIFQNESDNHFYLYRDHLKNYSNSGSIYSDNRCNFTGANASDNLIIYGHHMAAGTFFTGLYQNYRSLSFYKEQPFVYITTDEGEKTYVVISVMFLNTDESQDTGERFEYWKAREFTSQSYFDDWKSEAMSRSIFSTEFDYNIDDNYITLQTCREIYPLGKFVVIAREVRDGETIDTSGIERNLDMKLPSSWSRAAVEAEILP